MKNFLVIFLLCIGVTHLEAMNDLESGRLAAIEQLRKEIKEGLEYRRLSLDAKNKENEEIDQYLEKIIPLDHPLSDKNSWFREIRIQTEQDRLNWKFRKREMEEQCCNTLCAMLGAACVMVAFFGDQGGK